MGDSIEYCGGCETNQMCHMERKCMGKALYGDCAECKGSGGVCGEPCPDCDGVGWLESDIPSENA